MADWAQVAKRILRAEMTRRGVSWRDLAERLQAQDGQPVDEKVLRTRYARSAFSAAFFVQALVAMGVRSLNLEPPEG